MFQGPKGEIARMSEVHLQYGNSTTKMAVLHFFLVNSTLCIIYSLCMHISTKILQLYYF